MIADELSTVLATRHTDEPEYNVYRHSQSQAYLFCRRVGCLVVLLLHTGSSSHHPGSSVNRTTTVFTLLLPLLLAMDDAFYAIRGIIYDRLIYEYALSQRASL